MAYTIAFEKAIDHVMLYEIGGFFKLTPTVEQGLIDTFENCKACGYTNDPDDRGGETKFGIAKSANPDLDITNLDWEAAMQVYYKRYWLGGNCQDLPPRLAALHFDGCVNHGIGKQAKFLQESVGAIADGDIGPATLALVRAMDEIDVCNKVCMQRETFYRNIVANNGSQAKYLNGWLRRVHEMQAFVADSNNIFEE